jgi:hypothetical protein
VVQESFVDPRWDVLKLNVSGKRMDLPADLLTSDQGSLLAETFSGKIDLPRDDEGVIFVNRSAKAFEFMVDYLRRGQKHHFQYDQSAKEQLVRDELEYWGLDANYNQGLISRFPPKLVSMLSQPPSIHDFQHLDSSSDCLEWWRQIGPLNLQDIQRHSEKKLESLKDRAFVRAS